MFPKRLAIARWFAFLFFAVLTGSAAEDHATLPVTLYPGKAGDLVREWWKQGTAAGNVGDYYDNRDRGHRLFNLKNFPQITQITYTSNEVAAWLDYAGPKFIRTNVVIAN